jgi:hypothetical protein
MPNPTSITVKDAAGANQTVSTLDALLAATLAVGGSVAVSNLPATQPISGSVTVSNFPGSQPVTGPLTDSQLRAAAVPVAVTFPATQPVSGTIAVSNFPASPGLTDAQLRAAAVPVSGSLAVSNFPASQAVTGTVAVSNLPASQAVTGPLTDGQLRASAVPVAVGIVAASRARIASAASTNATSVKATAGLLYHIIASNTATSARFLKLYDKASAPVVGTDVPAFTIYLPPGGGFSDEFSIPAAFTTGIAYAITSAIADTDATAIAANDVHGVLLFA